MRLSWRGPAQLGTSRQVKGPLSGDVYKTNRWPESWWRASAPDWVGPAPLEEDRETDVAIIGGGYAGLSCALRLAEHGIGTMVLEAGGIGWGASGRNGGIVGMASHKLSDKALLRRYGEREVARAHHLQRDGVDRLRDFCAAHDVPMQGDGEVLLAHSARAWRALRETTPPDDVELDWLAPEQSGDMRRHGGVRIRPGFGVHPMRLVRAMAASAGMCGVQVHPGSEVLRWHREGARHRLETPRGTVRAGRVVLATNGFTPDGLHRGLDGRAVPVISNIAVTRVLTDAERAHHPWLGNDPVADTKNLLVYLRLLPEGRLLFGMRGDLTGAESHADAMRRRVAARLAQCFPGWAGVGIDYFWRGPICATYRFTPAIGRLDEDPSVYHAFGWHGSGVNGARVGGRALADVIAGGPLDSIPAPWRGISPRVPLPGLRPLYVGLSLVQQRLMDALG